MHNESQKYGHNIDKRIIAEELGRRSCKSMVTLTKNLSKDLCRMNLRPHAMLNWKQYEWGFIMPTLNSWNKANNYVHYDIL